MKTMRKLFATLSLLCIAGMATAQDVIVMKDQSTVMSKVLEITSTEIKYKKWNNQDGPTYSINRAEVVSINYENGEVEKFTETTHNQQNNNISQGQYSNNYMTSQGSFTLCLNGRPLSDKEIQNLVSPEDYQLYQKAGNQMAAGFLIDVVGGLSILAGGLISLVCDDAYTWGSAHNQELIAFTIAGCGLGITAKILDGIASDNTRKVADSYNKNHGSAYSLNISPSLMRCETPQSQGNCGLGLTLSMNF